MWTIGQDIVCIRDHSEGLVKEGNIYQVNGLMQSCCKIWINVGIKVDYEFTRCRKCDIRIKTNGVGWFSEQLFKPLDELSDISELLEVLNKENYQEV